MNDFLTVGIFADEPRGYTKSAVIGSNFAHEFCRISDNVRTIYFEKNTQENGFEKIGIPYDCYEIIKCGKWKSNLLDKIIQHYKLDVMLLYDDWLTAIEFVKVKKKIPLYLWTPIDSFPISNEMQQVFEKCTKVLVPNRSYQNIKNGTYLPYSVDWMIYKPIRKKMYEEFTFTSVGKNEPKKNIIATVLAFEKICKKYDCKMVIKSDWDAEHSKDIRNYIINQKLPIFMDIMIESPPEKMAHFYSSFHAYISSAKASDCEIEILEANACCLPALTTEWTFMDENIKDNITGFLIPLENEEEINGKICGNISISKLAEKMEWMIDNQHESLKMGIDGFSWVRENRWRNIAETVLYMMDEKGLY